MSPGANKYLSSSARHCQRVGGAAVARCRHGFTDLVIYRPAPLVLRQRLTSHPDLFRAIDKVHVKTCMSCRQVQRGCEQNPDANRGSCLALYREIAARPCAHCGTTTKKRELHHEDQSEKI